MTHDDSIVRHCREIYRCNQRGGRMLSVVDLIEAGILGEELAAYCLAAIGQGASFMVGAMPGGARKTTVMGALLTFVPPDVELSPADGQPYNRSGAMFSSGAHFKTESAEYSLRCALTVQPYMDAAIGVAGTRRER